MAEIAAGHAVIYLDGQPYPLTAAGPTEDGRLFYMEADKPHAIPEGLKVEVLDYAVIFREGGRITYYITPAQECHELKLGDVINRIETLREWLTPELIAEIVRNMGPN